MEKRKRAEVTDEPNAGSGEKAGHSGCCKGTAGVRRSWGETLKRERGYRNYGFS